MNDQKEYPNLLNILRDLPESELPRDLTPSIMENLVPKKLSIWRRWYLMFRTPHLVTITPFRLVTAAAACVLVLTMVFQLPPKQFETSLRQADSQLVPVTFSLTNQEANSVYLIGSFNGWQSEGYAMKRDTQSNRWILEISLPPGNHEYVFLIDDKQTIPDPQAAFYKQDGFGSRNSVIHTSSNNEYAF
jgi:hypothetical protein